MIKKKGEGNITQNKDTNGIKKKSETKKLKKKILHKCICMQFGEG